MKIVVNSSAGSIINETLIRLSVSCEARVVAMVTCGLIDLVHRFENNLIAVKLLTCSQSELPLL